MSPSPENALVEHHDILILGAGLTGINTAHILRKEMPHRDFVILEKRAVLGGTWSFFKYPGFRSDSYMSSFAFTWHPWKHKHKIAPASEIVEYIDDAARADGTKDIIRFRHEVLACEWSSELQQWRLDVDADGTRKTYFAKFILGCTGYYSYDRALDSPIPGIQDFQGQVVHPQFWPEDLDYSNKRVILIGSGATTVTVLPSMAEKASHVTMLQRSPSFVTSRPLYSWVDTVLRFCLPVMWAHSIICFLDTLAEVIATQALLKFPQIGRWVLIRGAKKELPKYIDVDVHFNPSYNPFQQRLCLCPEGDFFKALYRQNTEIVTDIIETVTKDGILLKSGRKLSADIIVTATGLHFQLMGGLVPVVDGKSIEVGEQYTWRGCMLESLPNAAFVMGYVTQSWTPGADAMAKTVIRVLKHMEETGATSVVPRIERTKGMPKKLAVNANSSYFLKAADRIPKVTGQGPWYGRTNLVVDLWAKWFGSVEEGLDYTRPTKSKDT
jgi:cation diffusion facilitator CzcD-associated flavoprotein CzcO